MFSRRVRRIAIGTIKSSLCAVSSMAAAAPNAVRYVPICSSGGSVEEAIATAVLY